MSQTKFHIGIKNRVTANADNVCELYFLDTIQDKQVFDWTGMTATTESLLAEVMTRVNAMRPEKITQYIDSWGGDADLGKGIYNFLKGYPAEVETKIVNKAASAATCIACAGSKISMPRTGMYVIHRASNRAEGTSDVLRDAADVADLYTDVYCEIYAANNRKGKTKDEIKGLIADGDYWMTGIQALEMGFVDECYEDDTVNVTANINAAQTMYITGDIPASLDTIMKQRDNAGFLPYENAATLSKEHTILNKIENTMKNFSELVTAAIEKIKGTRITARAGDDIHADVAAALKPALAELAASMQQEVTAEITAIKATLDDQYAKVIALQKTAIEKLESETNVLKTSLENLTADITAIAGAESRTGAKEKPANPRHPERRGLGN